MARARAVPVSVWANDACASNNTINMSETRRVRPADANECLCFRRTTSNQVDVIQNGWANQPNIDKAFTSPYP